MEKSAQAFRTISEVAQDLDLPQHVLRFWETRFVQIRPLKRGGGRRYYRPEDVDLLRAIRRLLYGEGYTIKGVQKILKEQGPRGVAAAYGGAGATAIPPVDADAWLDDEASDDAETAPEPPRSPQDRAASRDAADAPPMVRPVDALQGDAGFGPPKLGTADCALLQEILTDLIDCARILDAARSG